MYVEEIENEMKKDFRVNIDLRLSEAYVVGAGDSYASALVAEGETGGRFKAMDLTKDLATPLQTNQSFSFRSPANPYSTLN